MLPLPLPHTTKQVSVDELRVAVEGVLAEMPGSQLAQLTSKPILKQLGEPSWRAGPAARPGLLAELL